MLVRLDEQSPDIARGVVRENADQGAGDQGMMFGYACDETPEYMPLAISLAHRLTRRLSQVRKDGTLPYLRPDGKSQVTVEYDDDMALRIDAVVLSTQHAPEVDQQTIYNDLIEHVVKPVLPQALLDENTKYFVNPTGRFVIGGPQGDSGLTGRKIIVDTYGGYAHHGGGAFSGKDPSKVDRSAAYAMRHVAKNLVPPAWPSGARWAWPTPSAWRSPCLYSWTASAPARCPTTGSPRSSVSASICAPPPSSALWTSSAPSTARPPPTATSAAMTSICPGKSWTGWKNSGSTFERGKVLFR